MNSRPIPKVFYGGGSFFQKLDLFFYIQYVITYIGIYKMKYMKMFSYIKKLSIS